MGLRPERQSPVWSSSVPPTQGLEGAASPLLRIVLYQGVKVHAKNIRPGSRAASSTYSQRLCADYERVPVLPVMECKPASGARAASQPYKAPGPGCSAGTGCISALGTCTEGHSRWAEPQSWEEMYQLEPSPKVKLPSWVLAEAGLNKAQASDPSPELSPPDDVVVGGSGDIYSG